MKFFGLYSGCFFFFVFLPAWLMSVAACSILGFVAFCVTICYHTIYASPWIFPPLAFYGADILMRMFKVRIKDALLVPIDNQMTLVSILFFLLLSIQLNSSWSLDPYPTLHKWVDGRPTRPSPCLFLWTDF